MRAIAPLSDAEFATAMAPLGPFEPNPLLAVAVSGGPDSMALAFLASRWAAALGGEAVALIVDHGLRAEAAQEARAAEAALAGIGIRAIRRRIEAPPPPAGLPAWARRKRYRLLERMTADLGALHLLTAHHADDQAETVLLNLGRGSGAKGLAAMRPVRHGPGARLVRPLLGVSKARLAATAVEAGLPTADDPSNRDLHYARARVRQALVVAADAADAGNLWETADRLADEDDALEAWTAHLAAVAVRISPVGMIAIDRACLEGAPKAVALRLLARAAHAAGGRETPPRQARAGAALMAIRAGETSARTLGGAVVRLDDAHIRLWREIGRRPPETAPVGAAGILDWDGRFRLRIDGALPEGAHIGPLGRDGLSQAMQADRPPAWLTAAPRSALASLPGLWRGAALLALPRFQSPENHGLAPGTTASVGLWARFRSRRPIAPLMPC